MPERARTVPNRQVRYSVRPVYSLSVLVGSGGNNPRFWPELARTTRIGQFMTVYGSVQQVCRRVPRCTAGVQSVSTRCTAGLYGRCTIGVCSVQYGQCTAGVRLYVRTVYGGVWQVSVYGRRCTPSVLAPVSYMFFLVSSAGLRLVFVGCCWLTLGPWPRVSPTTLPPNNPSATASDGMSRPVPGHPWPARTVPYGTLVLRLTWPYGTLRYLYLKVTWPYGTLRYLYLKVTCPYGTLRYLYI